LLKLDDLVGQSSLIQDMNLLSLIFLVYRLSSVTLTLPHLEYSRELIKRPFGFFNLTNSRILPYLPGMFGTIYATWP